MAWRGLERLRDEHGDDGGETIGKDAVREPKVSRQEAFLPLRHDPGEMQIDFSVDLSGHRQQVAPFVPSLPTCDAAYWPGALPRECSEAFPEGHFRAFQLFGGIPTRIVALADVNEGLRDSAPDLPQLAEWSHDLVPRM